MADFRFSDFEISETVSSALDAMGYLTPTPVQQSTIPMVATGRDLMVQAQTGTGKTAAFGIPLIERLGSKPQGIRVLVLTPTRELAKQVADELGSIGKRNRVQTVAVYGGASIDKQIAEIKFAHVVAGTPGRVLDHLQRRTLRLDGLEALVLDEADEMLSMGFARELDQIMKHVPDKRQTLLFSATIPADIKRYAQSYMNEPEFFALHDDNIGADDVAHHYYMVSGVGRTRDLVLAIEYEEPESAIIFTNTRADSGMVATYLARQGYQAEYLNSDLPQKERERIMGLTKHKSLRFLVATDIAARGIDITQLSHVINFALPESPEVYIHRTGRTGRAGHKGTAISLIGPRELGVFYYLRRIYKLALQERKLPTLAEIELRREERKAESLVKEIREILGPGETEPELRRLGTRLLERDDAIDVFAQLLTFFKEREKRLRVAPKILHSPAAAAAAAAAPPKTVLADVPKPASLRPGARADTVESVVSRVAIVQGEFRGLPNGPKPGRRRPRLSEEERKAIEAQQRGAGTNQVAPDTTPEVLPTAPEVAVPPEADTPIALAPEAEAEAEAGHHEPVSDAPKKPEDAGDTGEPDLVSAPLDTDEQPEPTAPAERKRRGGRGRERGQQPLPPVADGHIRLYVNLGKRDKLTTAGLRELLAELAGLEPEDLPDIAQRQRHSYVTVARDYAPDLTEAVNGEQFGQKVIKVELAKDEP